MRSALHAGVVLALAACTSSGNGPTARDAAPADIGGGAIVDTAAVDGTSVVPDAPRVAPDATVVPPDATVAPADVTVAARDAAPEVGPPVTCPPGQRLCPSTPFNNEPASSFRCRAPVAGGCPAPDLIVRREWIVDDTGGNVMRLTTETFAASAAEITEGCILAPGTRRLLRFNFAALNVGNENLNVGRPDERDPIHWEFFTPHGHWHIKGWGDLTLRTLDGRRVGHGRKLSFCLEDNIRIDDMAGPRQFEPPLCENFDPHTPYEMRPEFGLSVGWGDEYPSNVRCQYIDLGGATAGAADYLPDGFYDLVVAVNIGGDAGPAPLYRESNYDNNRVTLRVEIRGGAATSCDDHAGDACAGGHVPCAGGCAP